MNVLVTASARFVMTEDGKAWTSNASLGYSVWAEYLSAYDQVHLLARAQHRASPPVNSIQVSGPGVKLVPLPYFVGPEAFLRQYWAVKRTIRAALKEVEAVQLRIPCTIGTEVYHQLEAGRPYGVEVVADPYDSFAPGAVRHPLRPFFRWWFAEQLRKQCANACAARYVTQKALQQRYPCLHYSMGVANVNLEREMIVTQPRNYSDSKAPVNILIVGTMDQLYKAPDVLIQAVAHCVKAGLDLTLTLVGDGQYRADLERQARRLGIGDRTYFCGQLANRTAVQRYLDQADLFILPSRQEGLPKAMMEAMARALPCIGSIVGGIPELLPAEDLVPPGDVTALTAKIQEVVQHPDRMSQMSARNLATASQFDQKTLQAQRAVFYHYVHEQTEKWLNQSRAILCVE
ncbi:MAG: glycosyltransferase family 4 protein [Leptolyngbyaceae cyanobacterium SL_5_9]|nr:glycosyltransferase family 4 protein [Leptolyngbyaceae cyanobacterium SL_5_9]